MNLDRLTEELWQRLQQERPRALLLGEVPEDLQKYFYVNEKPYEVIVIGKLTPAQLLQMPSDPVCTALLEGMPVYLTPQPWHKGNSASALRRDLQAACQRLLRYGVMPCREEGHLITAERARAMAAAGERPSRGSRLTPLARDILEGKEL